MDFQKAIAARRSIRKFRPDPLPRAEVEAILQAGILAPSAKNGQPWRFIVVEKDRQAMLAAMRAGLEREEERVRGDERHKGILLGARYTLGIMEQAPVTVFILNANGRPMQEGLLPYGDRFGESCNAQSIGAAIENICLAATARGIGSLWICDVFSAYHELCAYLNTESQLAAAVSLGYADEQPPMRPRMRLEEVTQWR